MHTCLSLTLSIYSYCFLSFISNYCSEYKRIHSIFRFNVSQMYLHDNALQMNYLEMFSVFTMCWFPSFYLSVIKVCFMPDSTYHPKTRSLFFSTPGKFKQLANNPLDCCYELRPFHMPFSLHKFILFDSVRSFVSYCIIFQSISVTNQY